VIASGCEISGRYSALRQAGAFAHRAYRPLLLEGKTACVVGAGGIGRDVGRLCAALGMRVLGTRRRPQPSLDLVRKYRLGNRVIYESTNRQRHSEATLEHLKLTKNTPRLTDSAAVQMLGAGKILYRLFRAGWSATAAALSLRITVNSLISGVHAECKSLEELLGAENAIVRAAQNLRSYLDTATTFDGGEDFFEL
jgi:NAD(P)-dependent dehydrogenase (short-subunit alcohol dehydrogenase family)